jgi:hypothetical protein
VNVEVELPILEMLHEIRDAALDEATQTLAALLVEAAFEG